MKYVIERTSAYGDKPHHLAKKESVIDTRNNSPEERWIIDIADLHEFMLKQGRLILNKSYIQEYPYFIEIYDYYRE